MLSIIQAAGWPIWPLILCSILAVAFTIERFTKLKRSRVITAGLLDEAIGPGWAVVAQPALLAEVGESTRAWWRWHDVAVLPATDPALQAWLRQHGVQAVMLRPDRYVAGTARDASALAQLTRALPWMKTPPSGPG